MSVNSVTSRNDYVGTGLVTTYSYSFRIFLESHLLVTKRTSAFVETTLVLNTDYTVTGVGDATGGTIVLATALEDDALLTIRRVLPLTQPTDIRNQGVFFPETHENAFDRTVMMVQQQQDILNRSFRAPENEVAIGELPSEEARASKLLGFDADGDPIATSGGLDGPIVSTFIETLLDDADAATARATLGIPAAASVDENALAASVAGAGLTGGAGTPLAVNPGTGLEISADTIRIAAAAAGDGLTGGGGSALAVNPGTGLEISADTVRIAAAAAGNGLTGGAGSALAVNVDDSTIEINSDSLRVKDGGITAAKLSAAVLALMSPASIQNFNQAISFNFATETQPKTTNVTISSIDTSKSYITGISWNKNDGISFPDIRMEARLRITSATNVEIEFSFSGTLPGSGTIDYEVSFTVVEWN